MSIKEIDDQHKTLIDMINALHEAMLANKARELQVQTITRMVRYAATHFALEEKYMKQFSYAGYSVHKKEHDSFTAKATELQDRMNKVGFILTLEILNLLRDWLKNHILVEDKSYAKLFNERGLQ